MDPGSEEAKEAARNYREKLKENHKNDPYYVDTENMTLAEIDAAYDKIFPRMA